MVYTADGFNAYLTSSSLKEIEQAAKSAPWANGGIYAGEHMADNSQIVWIIEPYIFNDDE